MSDDFWKNVYAIVVYTTPEESNNFKVCYSESELDSLKVILTFDNSVTNLRIRGPVNQLNNPLN
jgi:hypothetical protein